MFAMRNGTVLVAAAMFSGAVGAVPLGKVVDSFDAVPGAPAGTLFEMETSAPAYKDGVIVFPTRAGPARGYWRTGPAPVRFTQVVDTSTTIPGGSGNFTEILPFRFDGEWLLFRGNNGVDQAGYYTKSVNGGPLTMLANQSTPVPPDNTNTFGFGIGHVGGTAELFSLDAGNAVFTDNHLAGIYALDVPAGNVRSIAHAGFIICESPNYAPDLWAGADLAGDDMAVIAYNVFGNVSLYLAPLAGVQTVTDPCAAPALKVINVERVASFNVNMPNAVPFDGYSFNYPRKDGDTVVFRGGDGHGYFGLFAASAGGIITLVDTNTPVPGGSGNFQAPQAGFSLDRIVVGGGRVAFRGTDAASINGVYMVSELGGPIEKVVRVGDTLADGRVVFGASNVAFTFDPFQPDSMDGDRLALAFAFTDPLRGFGTGVYIAEFGDAIFANGFDPAP
jgi:hypothetical protein